MGITLILGPMFSGKTTEMQHLIELAIISHKYSVILKHVDDTRYTHEDIITTHSGKTITKSAHVDSDKYLKVFTVSKLKSVRIDERVEVIGIDEGHFFPDLLEACINWVNQKKTVIISALDGDYKQCMFQPIIDILPNCESIMKKTGICMRCRKNASSFTIRLSADTSQILVGSDNIYSAVCRNCIA